MTGLVPVPDRDLSRAGFDAVPAAIGRAGDAAACRFIEFFTATIRNKNTRAAYAEAVGQFFAWCENHRVRTLEEIRPVVIAAYIENHPGAAPTVKQHLAAIRMLFDFLVTGQIVPMNPAASVRGPKHVVKRGRTPVLKADQARNLIDSIKTDSVVGLRDRAIIGLMIFTFARVSAMVHMEVGDYYENGHKWWVRLHEKGGKRHEVPAHHHAQEYVHA
jgi:site-specific recombinase XerD